MLADALGSGPDGGSSLKISLAVQILAFSEGLLLAERAGVDHKVAAAVVTQSPIGSPMLMGVSRSSLTSHDTQGCSLRSVTPPGPRSPREVLWCRCGYYPS